MKRLIIALLLSFACTFSVFAQQTLTVSGTVKDDAGEPLIGVVVAVAGTGNAAGAVGLHAAIDYVRRVGFDTIHSREIALTTRALEKLRSVPHVHILGSEKPEEHCGILSFTVDGVHPHDISEILASDGVNIRAGHHCAQPLLQHLGCSSTARASFCS